MVRLKVREKIKNRKLSACDRRSKRNIRNLWTTCFFSNCLWSYLFPRRGCHKQLKKIIAWRVCSCQLIGQEYRKTWFWNLFFFNIGGSLRGEIQTNKQLAHTKYSKNRAACFCTFWSQFAMLQSNVSLKNKHKPFLRVIIYWLRQRPSKLSTLSSGKKKAREKEEEDPTKPHD